MLLQLARQMKININTYRELKVFIFFNFTFLMNFFFRVMLKIMFFHMIYFIA